MVEAGEVKAFLGRGGTELHVACHISLHVLSRCMSYLARARRRQGDCCMSYLARARTRQYLAPAFPKRKQCIIYPFVMTDVVLKSGSTDTGAMNRRHLVAIHGGMTSGFEVVHGLLDHVMVRPGRDPPPLSPEPLSLSRVRFLSHACPLCATLPTHCSQSKDFFLVLISRWLWACWLLMSEYFMFFI